MITIPYTQLYSNESGQVDVDSKTVNNGKQWKLRVFTEDKNDYIEASKSIHKAKVFDRNELVNNMKILPYFQDVEITRSGDDSLRRSGLTHPYANLTADPPFYCNKSEYMEFNPTNSSDPDGIIEYSLIEIIDEQGTTTHENADLMTVSHRFNQEGVWNVTLSVRDDDSNWMNVTHTVHVLGQNEAHIYTSGSLDRKSPQQLEEIKNTIESGTPHIFYDNASIVTDKLSLPDDCDRNVTNQTFFCVYYEPNTAGHNNQTGWYNYCFVATMSRQKQIVSANYNSTTGVLINMTNGSIEYEDISNPTLSFYQALNATVHSSYESLECIRFLNETSQTRYPQVSGWQVRHGVTYIGGDSKIDIQYKNILYKTQSDDENTIDYFMVVNKFHHYVKSYTKSSHFVGWYVSDIEAHYKGMEQYCHRCELEDWDPRDVGESTTSYTCGIGGGIGLKGPSLTGSFSKSVSVSNVAVDDDGTNALQRTRKIHYDFKGPGGYYLFPWESYYDHPAGSAKGTFLGWEASQWEATNSDPDKKPKGMKYRIKSVQWKLKGDTLSWGCMGFCCHVDYSVYKYNWGSGNGNKLTDMWGGPYTKYC